MHATFTGSSRRPRNVNLSGQNVNPFAAAWSPSGASSVHKTLSQAQAERQQRQLGRDRLRAAKNIQRTWRGYSTRKSFKLSQSAALQALYETPTGTREDRLQAALPLLFVTFRPDHESDQRVLSAFLADLSESNLCLVHDMPNPRLIRFLKLVLSSFGSREQLRGRLSSDLDSVELRLRTVVRILEARPSAFPGMLDRYYDVVGVLSEQGSLSIIGPPGKDSRSETFLRLVEQAVVVPISLKGGNEFVPGSYRALALSYLTRPDLGLVERQDDGQWTSEAFYQSVDVGRLSAAITEAYNTNEVALLKRDARLWLLCHYVDLHKSAFQRVQSPFYLECLYLQLSSLSSTIREVMVESATTGDDESSKAKKTGASSYVLRQLNSLAHKECLTLLLSGFSSNISSIVEGSAQELEYASLLAGYSLTLLRCFPREEDTIRMRLYLGDMSWRGREVPLVHYFWQAMKGTGVYAQILHDVGAPQRLLQPRSLRSASAQVTPLEKEWRIVIAFLELYTFLLRLTDDDDFFAALDAAHIAEDSPSRVRACSLSLEDVRPLTVFLKNLAFALFYNSLEIQQTAKSDAEISSRLDAYLGGVATKAVPETSKSAAEQQLFFAGISGIDFELMRNTVTTTLRMLHERDSRRKFLPQDHWLMTSRFDMEGFIPAVVMEEQRQRALRDADEEDEDEEEPVHEPEDEDDLYFATSTSRLSRHARIEALREKQRKVQRERMLASVGPRLEVLRNIPFVIPFKTRVQIFRQFIYLDKDQRRGGNVDPDLWRHAMLIRPPSGLQTGRDVLGRHSARIRRTNAFEDALDQFYELGDGLKEPIQIQFIDQFGQVEAGIDGGGVTKEFLTTVTREAFYEPKGIPLFVANEKNLLYPNPNAMDQLREYLAQQGLDPRSRLYQEQVAEFLKRYEFLGRVVGKCLYEGILVDIAFAGFFLLKWTQAGQSGTASGYRYNFNDLRDMDESLYQGLLALKNYKGDVSDLDLDFTVEDVVSLPNQPTKTVTHELMPGGARVKVTNENRPLYLSYMARHRLSVQPHAQSRAFLQGLGAMIEPSWLSMFNQLELQRLVGGDSSAIDVEDLRRNTEYSGAYTIGEDGQEHPTVRLFWEVMHELDHDTRCKVLRYVTSTPRAPLLGFSQLLPKFSIRDGGQDESRLPSTSTCVNLLKLPQYKTKKTLKEKLLYAVMSNAGFDLS